MENFKDILKSTVVKQIVGNDNVNISEICFDSRKVVPGSLFVAARGTQTDGHKFIPMAIEKGAVAVVCEQIPTDAPSSVAFALVDDASLALGYIASAFYGYPSSRMKLVGVTGTNGKTTTATLLYKMFRQLGYKVGLLSTVKYFVNDLEIAASHTTPDALQINKLMADMVSKECE